jgi:hypothetical protein
MKHYDQGYYSIPFTALGWILTLTTRTKDIILAGSPHQDGY